MRTTRNKATLLATALCGAGLFFELSGPLAAQNSGDSNRMSAADTKFAGEAAMGGMMEVELGKIAVQKSSNDKVKQFGQRMSDDHSKAADELKRIAAKENITLPTELDVRHRAMIDKYANLSGTAFDRAYMGDMVRDHQAEIADFQSEAKIGTNADLKSWATTTLPTLREHLRIARETDASLGVTSNR
jgi:putative membrane protein